MVAVARSGFAAYPLRQRVLVVGAGLPVRMRSQDHKQRLNMGFDMVVLKGTRSPRDHSLHPLHRCVVEPRDPHMVGSCTSRGGPLARFAADLA